MKAKNYMQIFIISTAQEEQYFKHFVENINQNKKDEAV